MLHYVRIGRARAALAGKLAALAAVPAILRDRRRVQAMRTAPVGRLTEAMERNWIQTKRREKAFVVSRVNSGPSESKKN
jgi:hypothetical protein